MSHQLRLPLGGGDVEAPYALPARLPFPIPTEGGKPFDDDERFFEPWWPGAQAYLRRVGRHLELRTEHLSDPLAAFRELGSLATCLSADGVIIEGTLLALDAEGRPDGRLLRRRLTGSASEDEVAEGAFVATDLAYLEGRSLAGAPFIERRQQLAAILRDSDHGVVSRGLVGEGVTLGNAVASLGLTAISARRLDGRRTTGSAGDAWLRLPVTDAPTLPTRPFLVLLEKLPFGE